VLALLTWEDYHPFLIFTSEPRASEQHWLVPRSCRQIYLGWWMSTACLCLCWVNPPILWAVISKIRYPSMTTSIKSWDLSCCWGTTTCDIYAITIWLPALRSRSICLNFLMRSCHKLNSCVIRWKTTFWTSTLGAANWVEDFISKRSNYSS